MYIYIILLSILFVTAMKHPDVTPIYEKVR